MRARSWLGFLLAATLGGGCGASADQPARGSTAGQAKTVVCFAAASTREPVLELIAAFERAHAGVTVRPSFAVSSTLAQQIASGAEAQLFISADEPWATFLAESQLVADSRPLLGNRLVLVVPGNSKLDLKRPHDLQADDIERIALGDPQSVPAGRYAKQALTRLELWDQLKSKVVGAADVRQALAFVETASAEAGIVYATDAKVSDRVRVAFEFDGDLTEAIVYPLVLLEAGRENPTARTLFAFLQSAEAQETFEQHGFTFLPGDDQ